MLRPEFVEKILAGRDERVVLQIAEVKPRVDWATEPNPWTWACHLTRALKILRQGRGPGL